jgi:hypothetical protein
MLALLRYRLLSGNVEIIEIDTFLQTGYRGCMMAIDPASTTPKTKPLIFFLQIDFLRF